MNGPGLINHRSSPAQLLKPTVTPESQTHTFLLRTRYSHVIGNSISHSSLVISSPFLAFPYRRSLGARSTDTYKDFKVGYAHRLYSHPFLHSLRHARARIPRPLRRFRLRRCFSAPGSHLTPIQVFALQFCDSILLSL
jgi:hypothetical protein